MAGCATSPFSDANVPEARPRVILARVISAGWDPKTARPASALYALKCGRCHKFYDPQAYDESDWQMWHDKMARKSKLTPQQERTLSEYLKAARK